MKMSAIQEMRARGLSAQPKKPSQMPMIAGSVAAFVAGGLLVMASGALPMNWLKASFETIPIQGDPRPVMTFSDDKPRLGRAASAPLMRQCLPHTRLGIASDSGISPNDAYNLIKTGSRMTGLVAVAGVKHENADQATLAFATLWGEVADCIYRQNGWALCDADNRALAVEAVNVFVQQAGFAKKSEGDASASAQRAGNMLYAPHQMQAVKDRVLASLRNRVEQGYMIAADFGMFSPAEVQTVLTRAQTQKNSCAEKR